MDYKYIEQLLERYWQCETSIEEERILQAFFSQKDIPAGLQKYRDLFAYREEAMSTEVLGNDFDTRILSMIEDGNDADLCNDTGKNPTVKARVITMRHRLMPLFKAAAMVAIIITLGNAAQLSFNDSDKATEDINYAGYKDTFSDPEMAYDKVHNALELVSEGFSQAQLADTVITATGNAYDSTLTE